MYVKPQLSQTPDMEEGAPPKLWQFVVRQLAPLVTALRFQGNKSLGDLVLVDDATYQVLLTDRDIIVDAGATCAITLPPAADCVQQRFTVCVTSVTDVTLSAQSGETISGASSIDVFDRNKSRTVLSDGVRFHVVACCDGALPA